ncbi:hypothetical protein Hanom_Chr15g01387521 [Helianthus anomalus]
MCFVGLMEFKELFGSFTSHRVKNRSSGTRYGSTGSARSEDWKNGVGQAVGDGYRPSPTGSGNARKPERVVFSNISHRTALNKSEPIADGVMAVGNG